MADVENQELNGLCSQNDLHPQVGTPFMLILIRARLLTATAFRERLFVFRIEILTLICFQRRLLGLTHLLYSNVQLNLKV